MMFLLLLLVSLSVGKTTALTAVDLAGEWSQVLRHEYSPEEVSDMTDLSICMRFYPR